MSCSWPINIHITTITEAEWSQLARTRTRYWHGMLFLEQRHRHSRMHICCCMFLKCSSLDAGYPLNEGRTKVTHTNKLLPELGEDSTPEKAHVIAISQVELQPHGSVQLTIVFHHPFSTVFLYTAHFFAGGPSVDADADSLPRTRVCPDIVTAQS